MNSGFSYVNARLLGYLNNSAMILYRLNLIGTEDMIGAAQACYDRISAGLGIQSGFQDECTFDAYITTDSEGDVSMHLIEINSGMFGWGPAGSSLFSWTQNPPPQVDETPVYVLAAAL